MCRSFELKVDEFLSLTKTTFPGEKRLCSSFVPILLCEGAFFLSKTNSPGKGVSLLEKTLFSLSGYKLFR
jgi:hypothetical protein